VAHILHIFFQIFPILRNRTTYKASATSALTPRISNASYAPGHRYGEDPP
jgi:hypothetical protein